jgi:hypothetical protein
MKKTTFWDIAPCSLVEVDYVSKMINASIIRALIMVPGSTSETSVNFDETTRRNIPEGVCLFVVYLATLSQ